MKQYFYSLSLVFCMLFCYSCNIKKDEHSQKNDYEAAEEIADQMNIDLPIGVYLVPVEDEYRADLGTDSPNAYMYFKVSNETKDLLEIEPISNYYNKYKSDKPMVLWDDGWKDLRASSDELTYPSFDFVLSNTTDAPINVNSLTLDVEESKIDTFPYLWIFEQCGNANSITIVNESWYNWGKIYFSYSILKKGEKFNGKYKKKITIPYFKDKVYVDFLSDLIEMGLKRTEIDNAILQYGCNLEDELKERMICEASFVVGRNASIDHIVKGEGGLEPESINFAELFYPFEFTMDEGISPFGFARVHGKIEFENSKFSKEFDGRIYLNPPGYGGAYSELSDEFNIELKSSGNNYELDVPYSCILSPGEIKRVRFTIKCSRSTNHKFKVRANNSTGLNILSKKIKLHLINGRHSTKQPEILDLYQPQGY